MNWEVPLVEIDVADEDVAAVTEALASGWLTMGPRIAAFEQELAAWLGSPAAIAVSSGSAALHLACMAAGVGPGDEVVVPDLSFVAAANAVRWCGAEPVFCDISSPRSPHASAAEVEPLLSPRTRAVIQVHLFGHPAPVGDLLDLLGERGVDLIEDCGHSLGARFEDGSQTGTRGRFGCFSFFSKTQLPLGEGGAVAAEDEEGAERIRRLRSHAMTTATWERHRGHGLGYDVTEVGFNYRMDEPRAALGSSRLARLDAEIERRRRVAADYRELLGDADGIELPLGQAELERASPYSFPVLVDAGRRDAFRESLASEGIQSTVYPPLHRLTEYAGPTHRPLSSSVEFGSRHAVLPLHAGLDRARVERIAAAAIAAAG